MKIAKAKPGHIETYLPITFGRKIIFPLNIKYNSGVRAARSLSTDEQTYQMPLGHASDAHEALVELDIRANGKSYGYTDAHEAIGLFKERGAIRR